MSRISRGCIWSRGICRLLFVTRRWRIACDHGIAFLLFQRGTETESGLRRDERRWK